MKSLVPIVVLILTTTASAQTTQKSLEPSVAKSVVQQLINDLDVYIFPPKADLLRTYLREHLDAYEATTTSEALAAKLTADMRTVTSDKHLAVFYNFQPPSTEATSQSL